MAASTLPVRAFQWDFARQVERMDWLLAQLPRYAAWGYQELHLHLEDAVGYPSVPGVARRDAYTYRQLGRLVDCAARAGIRVVPIVNLLGHTQYLVKVPELRDLNELRAADGSPLPRGQVCPLHPRFLGVAEKLLRDMVPFCTAGRVHVGLDESFHLGQHPLSRAEIARSGLPAHFAGHVNRLHGLVSTLGLRMGMWADMLVFLPEAIPLLPAGLVAYDWHYYPFRRHPRAELFNFAEYDLATPLQARGIEYWGCPMSGAFRHEPLPHFRDRLENILSWWRRCRRTGAAGFLVSSWEPNRLAPDLVTAIDAAAASLWLEPELTDPARMLERGFARAFGKGAKAGARVALQADRFPFGGCARWQINDRWDTVSRREPLAGYRQECRHFARLKKTQARPGPLRQSLAFRHYLAGRDVFVRLATAGKARADDLRRYETALREGRAAARAMWQTTRDARVKGPNERCVENDAARLRAWKKGAPVFGGDWQLAYTVDNFEPALQLVGVEQQRDDGSWELRQSCHTIEFQARAAVRRGGFRREHAAPVDWDGDPACPPRLRFVVRGLGRVRIGNVELTGRDGAHSLRPWKRGVFKTLGPKAPTRGLPSLDWTANSGTLSVRLSGFSV